LANNNVNLDLKIDPAKIINSAGKITLDDFKREFSKDFQELRKIIPDALIEAKLNETLAVVRNVKWGFTVQEYGAKSLLLAVQTPNMGLVRNGNKAQSFSFKIYKKAMKLQLLKAAERTELIKRASTLDLTIRTEKVPAGFTLFKSVSGSTASLHLFTDSNVEEGVIYVYRLYTSLTNYIEVTHQVKAVTPVISSFTATPDPLERKVKFNIDVKNATKIEIYKGSSTQPLANTTQDTAVVNGSTYTYTLKVSNGWGKTASRTVSARCVGMLPAKPVLTVTKDATYIRTRLSWTVCSNVSSCTIARVRKLANATATSTLRPTYGVGYYYDSGVVKGGVYAYTMTATNGWGSTTGTAVTVTMTGSAPAIPTITSLTSDRNAKVTVQYSRSANATSYKIYRTIDGTETLAGTSSSISFYDSSVPRNEAVIYKVSAVNAWGESAKSAGVQTFSFASGNNQIKRKALCVATKALGHSQATCQEMKKAFEHNGITVKYVENLSRKQFENELKSYFAELDADDYPIIMSNSHGGIDCIQLFIENNSPVTVTYAEYKKMLDKVPGHKILMIGCCHSGSSISTKARSAITTTFSDADLQANIQKVFSGAQTTGTAMKSLLRSADLATSDYSVLVSATRDEPAYGVNGFSEVPASWGKGLGWDFYAAFDGYKPCRHHADSNGNKQVTVAELSAYASANAKYSHPFCWPAGDNKVVATYTNDITYGLRYFKLQNKGAFVVRMKVEITDPSTGASSTWTVDSFAVGKSKTVDLSTKISKAGTKVVLVAQAVGGKTKKSGTFYYHPDSTLTASYKVSGTTLNVKLTQV
jgi:Fibronectin type 3 domain-containing protein